MKNISLLLGVLCLFVFIDSAGQNLTDTNSSAIENYFKLAINTEQATQTTTPQNKNFDSYVVVSQIGNYNTSYILTNKKNNQNISQHGDDNNYEYISYYNSNASEVNVLQNGDNNDVQIYGQNELAKSISIIQNTNDKALIIKNY